MTLVPISRSPRCVGTTCCVVFPVRLAIAGCDRRGPAVGPNAEVNGFWTWMAIHVSGAGGTVAVPPKCLGRHLVGRRVGPAVGTAWEGPASDGRWGADVGMGPELAQMMLR